MNPKRTSNFPLEEVSSRLAAAVISSGAIYRATEVCTFCAGNYPARLIIRAGNPVGFSRRTDFMKRFLLVVLVATLTFSVAGIAQTADQVAVHAPTVKMGWMDVERAITTCDEGVKIYSDIQKFVDTKNNELEAMKKEVDDLRTKLEVQSTKLTSEALMDLEERANSREVALQRFSEDTQRDITVRRQRMINTISGKMGPVIEKVAIEKGYDSIIIYDPQRDAWVNPALNVTEDIIKAYNQVYPAGAPTMPTAAKKP